jgi:transcription initiation factor TFIID TATA-box-binding protein
MAQTKPVIEIVNVVASATIEQPLDLDDITEKFPSVEYDPEQFPGAVFRLQNPKTAILLFSSGKMVCTGGKSKEMAVKAVNTVVQKLRKGKIRDQNKKQTYSHSTKHSLINQSRRQGKSGAGSQSPSKKHV